MTEPSLLKWTHRTHQGSERVENKDYFSIIDSVLGTWVFVIDVSTSSNATTILAKQFSENFYSCLQDFLKRDDLLLSENQSQEKCKWIIQQAFNATKKELKIGVASLLSLYRCKRSNSILGFCAGDCRLGLLNNKSIQWLSPVHTGANPLGNDFKTSMKLMPERHILTKSLNLRRNFEPEMFKFVVSADDVFVFATDGFWMELNEVQQQTFINEPDLYFGEESLIDDTSVLLVTWSELEQEFTPKLECNLSSEFKTSSNNLKIKNDNLLVISSRSNDFSGNAKIVAMATKTENKNEY